MAALLAIAALIGAFGGAAAPAATAAAGSEYLGVNLQPLVTDAKIPETRWDAYLRPLTDGQMRVHRLSIPWFMVENQAPVNGVHTYNWNLNPGTRISIDFQMTAMLRNGLRPQPTFSSPHRWALAKGGESWFPDYVAFVIAFTQRYGPSGTFWTENPQLPKLVPQDFEIWNEANSNHSWTGSADPAAYARLLTALYPQLKAAAPWARVHLSIGWPDASNYVRALFANGAGGMFDGIAFHPYAPTAPAILGLVATMRATVAELGRGDVPILVNETGQPAAYDGGGALNAYAGRVGDATRAATQALTAEALARSDCGVEQFLVYGITGSETSREPIDEGYMGILRYADATPNATGQALQRASLRWVAALSGGQPLPHGPLRICSPPDTDRAALLPLGLTTAAAGASCVRGGVTYDGNPMEDSTLVMETPDGRRSATNPNATGTSDVCIPPGPTPAYVDVHAEVPKIARSTTLRCATPITSCAPIVAQTVAPPTCGVKLSALRPLKAARGSSSSTKVRATLQCDYYKTTKKVKKKITVKTKVFRGKTVKLPRSKWRKKTVVVQQTIQPKFVVGYKVNPPKSWKGKKRQRALKERRLRTITLRHGKRVTFTVKRAIRKGDQVILTHKVNPKADALPRVKASVALKAPKQAKAPKTAKAAPKRR